MTHRTYRPMQYWAHKPPNVSPLDWHIANCAECQLFYEVFDPMNSAEETHTHVCKQCGREYQRIFRLCPRDQMKDWNQRVDAEYVGLHDDPFKFVDELVCFDCAAARNDETKQGPKT